ncbi:MAG: DapH/DapD/GlmU-related protein [Pseudomonadota bacterium]
MQPTQGQVRIEHFVPEWSASPFGKATSVPWEATTRAEELVRLALETHSADYTLNGDVAVHGSATVEAGAVLKGPAIIGPDAFIGANAYLRGGVFVDQDCVVGPCCELKSSFLFQGAKLAHLSFVGDSLLGADVNIEAGAIIANHRNELADRQIRIRWQSETIDTGVSKFGALLGNGAKVGANAVIAPGALLAPGAHVPRLGLVDQDPGARP